MPSLHTNGTEIHYAEAGGPLTDQKRQTWSPCNGSP
jgi:hypothetical protein